MTVGTIGHPVGVDARRLWPIPVLLTFAMFAIPSLLEGRPVSGQDASALVRDVLTQPLSEAVPMAMLVALKLLLLMVAVLGLAGVRHTPRIVLTYYAAILVVVGLFQNAADLGVRGFAFLTGNAVGQLAVALLCLVGLRHATQQAGPLRRSRLWVVPLMLLAWAYPYAVTAGVVQPSASLVNGSGVTYCMITPIVAGLMLLRPEGFPRRAAVAVGSLGTLFGVLNMLTWFVFAPANWWMGVLHIPLLVISVTLALTVWRRSEAAVLGPPADRPEGRTRAGNDADRRNDRGAASRQTTTPQASRSEVAASSTPRHDGRGSQKWSFLQHFDFLLVAA